MDAATIGPVIEQIPYTRDLGLVIEEVADGEVRMTLPDRSVTRNLAGTVHAGALFTFGQTVAGLAAGLRTFDRAFPFARRAVQVSGAGESHPRALLEPCVNVSAHTAPITQLFTVARASPSVQTTPAVSER